MHSLFQILMNLKPKQQIYDYSYYDNFNQCEYFSKNRMSYYQQENFFTYKCPLPSPLDYFSQINFTEACENQAQQFEDQDKFIKNDSIMSLENIFGFLFSGFPQSSKSNSMDGGNRANNPQENQKQINYSAQNMEGDYRDMVSLNMQLKSKSIIGFLFIIAFLLVLFRITKKSELMRQKLPKTISIFWFFSTISLYLDLNIFSLDSKPYQKLFVLSLAAIDQSTVYIPEILLLILFIVTLFYFFSLIFRFNELFGHEEVEQLVDQFPQFNRDQGQVQLNGQQQEIGGLVSQSLLQIDPLSIRSSLEFYHFVVLYIILFVTFIKLLMLHQGLLFVRMTNFSINTLDNLELFPNSPRLLSLFTISFFAFSQFIGRTGIDKTQYVFQKVVPFFIALLHSTILVLKRRYIFTLDDIFCLIIFVTSIALYFTYESPSASANNRFPWPFLHSDANKKRFSDDQMKQLLKDSNTSVMNEFDQMKLSPEDLQRRQNLIESALKKRQQDHEEYMRQKELISQKYKNYDEDDYKRFQYENEEEDDSDANDDISQYNPTLEHEEIKESPSKQMFIMNKDAVSKAAQIKLQELLLQQLNQMNEETQKILQLGGGIDFSNDQEIMQKLGILAKFKSASQQANTEISQQLAKQSSHSQMQQVPQQVQATQGGQGQQTNVKQTAHKAPTKAPSGRPNQRKRR